MFWPVCLAVVFRCCDVWLCVHCSQRFIVCDRSPEQMLRYV